MHDFDAGRIVIEPFQLLFDAGLVARENDGNIPVLLKRFYRAPYLCRGGEISAHRVHCDLYHMTSDNIKAKSYAEENFCKWMLGQNAERCRYAFRPTET